MNRIAFVSYETDKAYPVPCLFLAMPAASKNDSVVQSTILVQTKISKTTEVITI